MYVPHRDAKILLVPEAPSSNQYTELIAVPLHDTNID
jgi:hypothetical protein